MRHEHLEMDTFYFLICYCFSVHLKIHVPEVFHKHKHINTKLIHIFHPKVVHTDHASVHYLHSRKDPSIGLVNGGYPQPLVNMGTKPELRITEAEFNKWRKEQFRKALEERKRHQDERNQLEPDDEEDEDNDRFHETPTSKTISDNEDDYEKHKPSSSSDRKHENHLTKHENHNYNQNYEATNSDKSYANYPRHTMRKKKPFRPSSLSQQTMLQRPLNPIRKNQPKRYGFIRQNEAEASNINPQYYKIEPTGVDPTYYTTLPKDQDAAASDNQDDIYSGLLSARYNKKIADKSKLLADINYNRKKQTKAEILQRRNQ